MYIFTGNSAYFHSAAALGESGVICGGFTCAKLEMEINNTKKRKTKQFLKNINIICNLNRRNPLLLLKNIQKKINKRK